MVSFIVAFEMSEFFFSEGIIRQKIGVKSIKCVWKQNLRDLAAMISGGYMKSVKDYLYLNVWKLAAIW